MGDTAVFPSYVDLNPNLDVMNMYQQQDEHLSNKIKEKTKAIAKNSQNIRSLTSFMNKLRDEYGIGMNTNGKKINEIDFSKSPEIKELLDRLSEMGLIDAKYQTKYTFHSAVEIEMFMAHLEGKIEEIKNDNEPNLLLIQPLLDLMKQLADIVRKINESDEKLKEMTHRL
ncbi:MAG: hypothetical protein K1060chlam1_00005 [Candidatus Anoxychlamydiales bacterium]|nr:hypothetical protein [Candidatus Anoxychlamydiales bacterium]